MLNLSEFSLTDPLLDVRLFRVGSFVLQGEPSGTLYSARPYDLMGVRRADGDPVAMLRDLAVTLRKLADEADAIANGAQTSAEAA